MSAPACTLSIVKQPPNVLIEWQGGLPPFQLWKCDSLTAPQQWYTNDQGGPTMKRQAVKPAQ